MQDCVVVPRLRDGRRPSLPLGDPAAAGLLSGKPLGCTAKNVQTPEGGWKPFLLSGRLPGATTWQAAFV
jgi:hypothetical protein